MNFNRDNYLNIFNAGKKCQQVFVKRQLNLLEPTINALLKSFESNTSEFHFFNQLIINLSDSNYDYLTNLLVKQVAATQILSGKLNYQQSAQRSNIIASLFILYALTPAIIKAKKQGKQQNSSKTELQKSFTSAALNAFAVAKKIQLKDQDSLKILSQLSRRNKFFNTNQLCQSIVNMSVNINLRANLGLFNTIECFQQSYSQQFTHSRYGQLNNPYISNYALILTKLINPNMLVGSIGYTQHKDKLLILSPAQNSEPNVNEWLCMPLTSNTNQNSEIIELPSHDVKYIIPQPKVDLGSLIDDLIHQDLETNQKFFSKQKTTTKNSNLALKYQAPKEWKRLAQVLQLDDPNKLVKQLSNSENIEQHRLTLLKHATLMNRENVEISDLRHAINLLGTSRLFPIVLIAALQAQQNQYQFSGSAIVNNKVDLFAEIVQELAKANHRQIPEYLSVVGRLLFLGLITIPKACFAASSQTLISSSIKNKEPNKESNKKAKWLSLAHIYKINDVNTWKKISCQLAKLWFLPTHQQSLILAYFEQLAFKMSGQKLTLTPAQKKRIKSHENEIQVIEHSSQIFAELTEIGQINPLNIPQQNTQKGGTRTQSIDDMLLADKDEILMYPELSNHHLLTPLS